MKLTQHSRLCLKKLTKEDLEEILKNKDAYGECTILRVKYLLTDFK